MSGISVLMSRSLALPSVLSMSSVSVPIPRLSALLSVFGLLMPRLSAFPSSSAVPMPRLGSLPPLFPT